MRTKFSSHLITNSMVASLADKNHRIGEALKTVTLAVNP